MTANKYDHIRLVHTEPSNSLYQTLIRHTPFCRAKKNSSLNAHKFPYVYFIDDLNSNAKCSLNPNNFYGAELVRHLIETNSLYSPEDEQFMTFSNINYILSCTLPNKTPNSLPLKQSLTKHLICVNLGASQKNLIESVFLSPIQHWLEEFPPDAVLYPAELANVSHKRSLHLKFNLTYLLDKWNMSHKREFVLWDMFYMIENNCHFRPMSHVS